MDPNWDRNPEVYARQVIDRCGFTRPPICERAVSQFFGNEVKEVSPSDPDIAAVFPAIGKIFKKSSAHLFREHSLIVVNKDQPRVKIRMDIFHENGHEALPWQRESAYVCADSGIDAKLRRQVESEAFACGIAMMLPDKMFLSDMDGNALSEKLIRSLAQRYDASLEVTAMRFVGLHEGECAMLVCEPSNAREKEMDFSAQEMMEYDFTSPQKLPSVVLTYGGQSLSAERNCPLQIRYSICSPNFKKFFRARTPIPEESPIFYTFKTGDPFAGLLHPDELGSIHTHAQSPYTCECFKFGSHAEPKVMVLLYPENHQQSDLF